MRFYLACILSFYPAKNAAIDLVNIEILYPRFNLTYFLAYNLAFLSGILPGILSEIFCDCRLRHSLLTFSGILYGISFSLWHCIWHQARAGRVRENGQTQLTRVFGLVKAERTSEFAIE